jgi:CHAT domain-containing protein
LWDKKLPKAQALREAQLWMIREGRRGELKKEGFGSGQSKSGSLPPWYWAGFVLSGDWR